MASGAPGRLREHPALTIDNNNTRDINSKAGLSGSALNVWKLCVLGKDVGTFAESVNVIVSADDARSNCHGRWR